MNENNDSAMAKESQPENIIKSKKEKHIDYQNTEVKMKNGQELVGQNTELRVYNPTSNIVEIDLGRDKSVRIQPYGEVKISKEYLDHPGLKNVKDIVKIY